jgi:hypothetical protein
MRVNTARGERLLVVAVLMEIAALGAGCQADPRQLAWHRVMSTAADAVYERESSDALHIRSVDELRKVSGSPDLILGTAVLEAALSKEPVRQDYVMRALARGLLNLREARAIDRVTSNPEPQDADNVLSDCSLWLYEEYRHFACPLPVWGWRPGFMCYVFVVQEDEIVGVTQLLRWEPLPQ